jgi:hypothetical protein
VLRRPQAFQNAGKRQGITPCEGIATGKRPIKNPTVFVVSMHISHAGLTAAVHLHPLTE